MPKSIALLFSGQGAQQVGMGKDLSQQFAVAANRFAAADAALGYSISHIAFDGPIEELTKTSHCQVALYVHGIAVLEVLREQLDNLEFVAAAGLSLGEFTAHAAAGTFDFLTGLRLVANRGRYMEEACDATCGTMAAFIGGDEINVREIAREADVDIANVNSPGQIVLSGEVEKIRKAVDLAKQYGMRRAVPLNVAGAFHSRLMRSAEVKLRRDLAKTSLAKPKAKVVANITAQPVETTTDILESLAKQVTGTVRWTESVQTMIDQLGCDVFLELGPGEVLAGLVGRIRKGAEVLSVADLSSLETGLARLRHLA
ncbi:MAG: ACP S-malonyltransferase [Verrucomicrobia bacterium]|nr:ACP S-malonyltransferase [Verrucomicrobiota bacterium]